MPFLQPEYPHATATGWLEPSTAGLTPDDHPMLHAWAARVDAGRGNRAPMPPEEIARIAQMEAIRRAGRRGARL